MKTKITFYKGTGSKEQDGISPKQILYSGIALRYPDQLAKYGISVRKSDKAFFNSGIKASDIGELHCIIYTVPSRKIELSEVELTSGTTRIEHAENLILQLLEKVPTHEGALSWLGTYGQSQRAFDQRKTYLDRDKCELVFDPKIEAYFN